MSLNHPSELREAGAVVAAFGLSDAFGHLSVRSSAHALTITPPVPLSLLTDQDEYPELSLDATELPPAAPKEAWIHLAIAEARPEVGAICRAQPPAVAALVAAGQPVLALNGHGSFLGETVPVYPDSRLIRDADSASRVSETLGESTAVILRGNGAVTTGPDIASAVALMWVLEKTAQLNLAALGAGTPHPLPLDEQSWWRDRATELLPRIYNYLTTTYRKGQ
ncbi:class II aldolase/adducin family protein [Salinibacterium sp. ZJ454]|uniref:class II aldolase/adducin family protein n=1 Tax=Salinibacterium sp. ZJ454 TaxID=2708339 RepID=UPI0014226A00|nr:class II aldolase/adducin family protein [Salinibacterium sp. ZJ454]